MKAKWSYIRLVAVLWAFVLFSPATQGQFDVSNLYLLNSASGSYPASILLSSTNLYGVTHSNGAHDDGTLFSVSTTGNLNWTYSFSSEILPESLFLGNDGNLYVSGESTVFSFTTNGTLRWEAAFGADDTVTSMLQGMDGQMYGTVGITVDDIAYEEVVAYTALGHAVWSQVVTTNTEIGAILQGRDGNLYGTGGVLNYEGSPPPGSVFCLGTNKSVRWVFPFNGTNGSDPNSLMQGTDGNLYGTTVGGGAYNFGTIFAISTNGVLQWSYSFPTVAQASPDETLLQGPDGNLYGTTGANLNKNLSEGGGSVFSITTNGILNWSYQYSTSSVVSGKLLLGLDGNLFCASDDLLFSITTNGIWNASYNLSTIYDSDALPSLFQGANGTIYGACQYVGNDYMPIVSDGALYEMPLSIFVAQEPTSSTNFYGASVSLVGTAVSAAPCVYQWQKNGTNLTDTNNVSGSSTCLLQLTNLTFVDAGSYGVIVSNSFGVVTSKMAQLTIVNPLAPTVLNTSISGVTAQSANLSASVAPNGAMTTVWFQWGTSTNYGNVAGLTTFNAGSNPLGVGLPVATTLTEFPEATILHVRTIASNSIGTSYGSDQMFIAPGAASNVVITPIFDMPEDQTLPNHAQDFVQGIDGNLYIGTQGGAVYSVGTNGVVNWTYDGPFTGALIQGMDGNLYDLGDTGSLVSLATNSVVNWTAEIAAGLNSQYSALIQGGDSTLYGALETANSSDILFSMTTNGQLNWTNLFGGTNGNEVSALAIAGGYLFGAATDGGMFGNGAVICWTTNGVANWLFSFNGTNGTSPTSIILGADGNLYGATESGGTDDDGTIFSMTTNGTLNWSFSFNYSDGAAPIGSLVQGLDGNIYGTTWSGGYGPYGTIFEITTNGVLTDLYAFPGGGDWQPRTLICGINGTIYVGTQGTTGLILQLSVTLPPVYFNVPFAAGGTVYLSWVAQSQYNYQIQWTSDVTSTNWQNLGSPVTNVSGSVSVSDSLSNACRFYRILETQ